MAEDTQSPAVGASVADQGSRRLELSVLVTDTPLLKAALEAGADWLEFAGPELPARRPARDFGTAEFQAAVQSAHAHKARVRLVLEREIAEDELRQAAGLLEWAREYGVDAVLVRDPALLALRSVYPQLDFHLQLCANSADVAAAGELGATRVVLAYGLTLAEIADASAVPGVETEAALQAPICGGAFPGLLPDWIGHSRTGGDGRSEPQSETDSVGSASRAGRAAADGGSEPQSEPDGAPQYRLEDLSATGVAAVRIETRGQTAATLRQTLDACRRVLAGEAIADLPTALSGSRGALRPLPARAADEGDTAGDEPQTSYDLQVLVGGRRIEIRCTCHEHVVEWSIPKTFVRRPQKAISVETLLRHLQAAPIQGHQLAEAATDDLDYLLVPRAANSLMARISTAIHQALKKRRQPLEQDLPAEVEDVLAAAEPDPANRRTTSDPPDRVRLHADQALAFLDAVRPDGGVIVEGARVEDLREIHKACRRVPLIVALPALVCMDQLAELDELLQACHKLRAIVEVNSWGGWRLARAAGVRLESGPGLPIRNSLAARSWAHLGVQGVTASLAAGRKQLEQLSASCPVSWSLVVFGRPALLTARSSLQPCRDALQARGVQGIIARPEGPVWTLRPQQPFDLRGCRNPRIAARHLVVDLIGSPDPVWEWERGPAGGDRPFRFNYDRSSSVL